MKSILITAVLAASTLAFAPQASAQPVRHTIKTADLDLSTARGLRTLDLRILHAASALCGTPSPSDARGRKRYETCRTDARATAQVQREEILAAARGDVRLAAK